MESFLKAVVTFWATATCAATRAKMTGGLWLLEAPQAGRTAGPYVVMIPLDGWTEHHNDGRLEMPVIQFSLFTESEDATSTLIQGRDEFVAAFDDKLLTLANTPQGTASHFQMRRDGYGAFVKEPEEGYGIHLSYQVGIDQAA